MHAALSRAALTHDARTARLHTHAGAAGGLAQGLLFVFALGSLLYKRNSETPKRPLRVWAFDVSKQGLSSLAAHVSGMMWSFVLSGEDASECAFYFLVFTVDTTVGVALALALHRRAVEAARRACERTAGGLGLTAAPQPAAARPLSARELAWAAAVSRSGQYGEPPSSRVWGAQLAVWCACVILGACVRACADACRVM
jgi:hypothetical protein